ncbi:MAG: N-acetyl-gamma-glutamyl-phosphate reductase [Spirochaetales bacterium]|uniref:N-acetyl-gamma-glutamyl-phosphate reductase n=1 Tax=Candidatus Thalassospirochaeta sargassi TaxID=3119039 RepID=A0AAJ1IHK2_9SPIO|nr:N-acetyl-gamma-glutamyl-phosphate reductase [Spirochaetales bacterium]
MKAAILGATGYTGMILLRLLSDHPEIDEIIAVSSTRAGKSIKEIDPGVYTAVEKKMQSTDVKLVSVDEAAAMNPEVTFAALPHLESAKICGPFFETSVVIDLSADFRIKDPVIFEKAYGQKPERQDLLDAAVYGLCEIYRSDIKKANLISNPGCYPTATLLPLIPVIQKFGACGKIVANAMSGISGAGKKAVFNNLFVERTENCGAYAPGKSHRHQPEIKKELDAAASAAGKDLGAEGANLFFTPHLVPLKRGMEITTILDVPEDMAAGLTDEAIDALYTEYYGNSPFVAWDANRFPQSRDVWAANSCRIGWRIEGRSLMLFSTIDNLVKGASGQAVQNMNIRFGFDETAGLRIYGEL